MKALVFLCQAGDTLHPFANVKTIGPLNLIADRIQKGLDAGLGQLGFIVRFCPDRLILLEKYPLLKA